MNKILLLVLFISIHLMVNAQSTFSKQIKTIDNDNTARTVIQDSGGYTLSGIGHENIFNASHIFFNRVNNYGDSVSFKQLTKDSFDIFPGFSGSLCKINGGYILGGGYDLPHDRLFLW